jgi:hypothetical protein
VTYDNLVILGAASLKLLSFWWPVIPLVVGFAIWEVRQGVSTPAP